MNTDQNENTNEHEDERGHERVEGATPTSRRPFGFWLSLVDRRLSEEMAELFADEGLSRRDWRALNLLAGGARDEHLAAKLDARPQLLHRLAERGWLEPAGTEPHRPGLTEAGREARERLQSRVDELRSRIAGAVSEEDFATTLRTLEAVARELGWDESQPLPRGRRGGRRFGDEHGHEHEHEHHGRRRHGGRVHGGREHGGRGHGRWQPDLEGRHGHGHAGYPGRAGHERHPGHLVYPAPGHAGYPGHPGHPGFADEPPCQHHGHAPRDHGHAPREHGRRHGFGRPEHVAGHLAPHSDVQVHIHVHG